MRVPEYSPYAVAEHAVALMMSLNRKIHKAYNRTRDNNFSLNGLLGFDMHAKTAGVIGTGKIGRILIKILKGFGMNVIAYDLYPNKAMEEETGFKYVDLKTVYKESDIISLHCPLTKETYHLINEEALNAMKNNIMLINTGRGKLIDTKALIDALKSKKIGFAGLDVYEEENEYFFEDFSGSVISDDTLARLLTFNNVIISSHQAFFTREAMESIAKTTLQNIKDFLENKLLANEICYKCENKPCRKKESGKCF
jgi:D-lactate dehydrogenase